MATDDAANGLTQTERDQYTRDGFFVRANVFSDAEIEALCHRVELLIEQVEQSETLTAEEKKLILKRNRKAVARTGPDSLNSLFRIHLFSKHVREHIRDSKRLEPVIQMLGPDLFCPNDLYFFKPPGTGRPIAWHQDSWYFNNTYADSAGASIEEASIGTWLAVDDASVDNGCLWVIPGSHTLGVVDHSEIGHGEELPVRHRAEVSKEAEAREVPVEVTRGSLVFFNNALLHRSTPNQSDHYRRAYVVHYMKSTITHTDPTGTKTRPANMGSWGTVEAHISGRHYPGCVQTTSEVDSLDWDVAVGRDLTRDETTIDQ